MAATPSSDDPSPVVEIDLDAPRSYVMCSKRMSTLRVDQHLKYVSCGGFIVISLRGVRCVGSGQGRGWRPMLIIDLVLKLSH